jgi:uncharacterized membrane protein
LVILLILAVAETQIMAFIVFLGYAISGPIWSVIKFGQKMRLKVKENKKKQQKNLRPGRDKE